MTHQLKQDYTYIDWLVFLLNNLHTQILLLFLLQNSKVNRIKMSLWLIHKSTQTQNIGRIKLYFWILSAPSSHNSRWLKVMFPALMEITGHIPCYWCGKWCHYFLFVHETKLEELNVFVRPRNPFWECLKSHWTFDHSWTHAVPW